MASPKAFHSVLLVAIHNLTLSSLLVLIQCGITISRRALMPLRQMISRSHLDFAFRLEQKSRRLSLVTQSPRTTFGLQNSTSVPTGLFTPRLMHAILPGLVSPSQAVLSKVTISQRPCRS